jgi:hypothetical protein
MMGQGAIVLGVIQKRGKEYAVTGKIDSVNNVSLRINNYTIRGIKLSNFSKDRGDLKFDLEDLRKKANFVGKFKEFSSDEVEYFPYH